MKSCGSILAVSVLFLLACAPVQPKPDPLREEVAILQKQLLELQKHQIETRTRLDASSAAVDALSAKILAMEELEALKSAQTAQVVSIPVTDRPVKKTVATKKKTVKKPVKKVRRQE